MDWELWSAGAASAGNLALAFVVLQKARRGPLAILLVLLCIVTATWNLGALLHQLTEVEAWHLLDICVSPWTAPVAFHIVLTFVGRSRQLRPAVFAGYLWGGVVSAWPLVHTLRTGGPPVEEVPGLWPIVYLLGITALLVPAFGLLSFHLRRQRASGERARTRLFMGALLVGGILAATELLDTFVAGLPSLGAVGSLLAVSLLTVAVLRFDLLRRAAGLLHLFYAAALAVAFVVACYLAVRLFSSQVIVLLVVLSLITLAVVAAVREWSGSATSQRERLRHLVGLGRMSAQMAHDLKNPLAALKGTVQYLEVELEDDDRALRDVERAIRRLSGQVDRIARTVDKYQGIGRVEPSVEPTDLTEVVDSTLDELASSYPTIDLRRHLRPVPTLNVDPELLRLALENFVRNAAEAMPDGGTVTVTLDVNGDGVRLTVADEGVGMSARDVERALDDFYTTKAQGSGLGLSFARRVARAHGGTLHIESALQVGTTVTLDLPAEER